MLSPKRSWDNHSIVLFPRGSFYQLNFCFSINLLWHYPQEHQYFHPQSDFEHEWMWLTRQCSWAWTALWGWLRWQYYCCVSQPQQCLGLSRSRCTAWWCSTRPWGNILFLHPALSVFRLIESEIYHDYDDVFKRKDVSGCLTCSAHHRHCFLCRHLCIPSTDVPQLSNGRINPCQ